MAGAAAEHLDPAVQRARAGGPAEAEKGADAERVGGVKPEQSRDQRGAVAREYPTFVARAEDL